MHEAGDDRGVDHDAEFVPSAADVARRVEDEDTHGFPLIVQEGSPSQYVHLTKEGLLRFTPGTNIAGVGSVYIGQMTRVERLGGTQAHQAYIHYFDANGGKAYTLEIKSRLLPHLENFMKRHEISGWRQQVER